MATVKNNSKYRVNISGLEVEPGGEVSVPDELIAPAVRLMAASDDLTIKGARKAGVKNADK